MITPSGFNFKFNPYNQTVHSNKIFKRSKYRKFISKYFRGKIVNFCLRTDKKMRDITILSNWNNTMFLTTTTTRAGNI